MKIKIQTTDAMRETQVQWSMVPRTGEFLCLPGWPKVEVVKVLWEPAPTDDGVRVYMEVRRV